MTGEELEQIQGKDEKINVLQKTIKDFFGRPAIRIQGIQDCPAGSPGGIYNDKTRSITLCLNLLPHDLIVPTIRHELIHAVDSNRGILSKEPADGSSRDANNLPDTHPQGRTSLGDVFSMMQNNTKSKEKSNPEIGTIPSLPPTQDIITTAEHEVMRQKTAYSEIRAANLSGDCDLMHEFYRGQLSILDIFRANTGSIGELKTISDSSSLSSNGNHSNPSDTHPWNSFPISNRKVREDASAHDNPNAKQDEVPVATVNGSRNPFKKVGRYWHERCVYRRAILSTVPHCSNREEAEASVKKMYTVATKDHFPF